MLASTQIRHAFCLGTSAEGPKTDNAHDAQTLSEITNSITDYNYIDTDTSFYGHHYSRSTLDTVWKIFDFWSVL